MAYVHVDETVLRKYMERTNALELLVESFKPMFEEWQRFKDEDALRKLDIAANADALDPAPFTPNEVSTNPNHPAPEHPRDEHGRFLPVSHEPELEGDDDSEAGDSDDE
jgi:hypothetical protein